MAIQLTSEQVWKEMDKEVFAVVGMVTADNEARTVGVVYKVMDGKLVIGTGKDTWKARHIRQNPHVSVTVPIAKRVPIMPWVKIPQATITFAGEASVIEAGEAPEDKLRALFLQGSEDEEMMADMCLIEIRPVGEFITYGVGVPMMAMRTPEKARGRAPVA